MVRFVSARFQQSSTKEKRASRAVPANDDKKVRWSLNPTAVHEGADESDVDVDVDGVGVEMPGYTTNPMASHISAGKRRGSSRVRALDEGDAGRHSDVPEKKEKRMSMLCGGSTANTDDGTDNDQRMSVLERKMDEKFESIDQKFESIDQKFESMNFKIESMDQKFEAMMKLILERIDINSGVRN